MTPPTESAGAASAWWRYPPLRNALFAGLIALSAFVLARLKLIDQGVENILYGTAIPLGAFYWAREGLQELVREHELGIEVLMLSATAGCGVLGLWDEAAALVVLFGAAEGLEGLAFAKARRAIRGLLDLAPKQARLLRDGQETLVAAEELRIGDLFLVRPGEALATDGVIVDGVSNLDESAITGESVPVDKGPGDKVFAASLNGQGAITVQASTSFQDNTLSKIIHLVEEAQEQKGRAQAWIERFGRRYSPAVLVGAVLIVMVPWLVGWDTADWARRAVVLLVAAAPCALVISLPIAMAAGIGAAGRRGILIKGGAHLENLGSLRTIAFDKTGTLTLGRPSVTDIIAIDGDARRLLAIAAALDRNSEHPLARAVVEAAHERNIELEVATGFKALVGAGVQAEVAGVRWYLAKPDFFRKRGLFTNPTGGPLEDKVKELEESGKTVVVVGSDRRLGGLIAFQDTVRPDAQRTIELVHQMGLATVMLTGDNERAARHVARMIGIDDVRAGLHPDDKVKAVRELAAFGPILMVGDGVNDAPALAAATSGVAMGAAGTDAAIEAADIALMGDDLGKLVEALQLGRKARRVSKQNVVFSLVVLAALVPLAVGGLISVSFAVLAHEASELLAVANGLRAGAAPP